MPSHESLRLKGVVPLLQVGSMPESLAYYQDVLGFTLDFHWPPESTIHKARWAGLSRDAASFMLTLDLGTSSSPYIAERGNGVVFMF
jgi:hypothetical protein